MKTIRLSALIVLALFGAGTLHAGNGPGRKGLGPRSGNAASDVCTNPDCPRAGNRSRKGKGKADGKGQGQRSRKRDGSGNGNGNGGGNGNGNGRGNGDGSCRNA